MKHVAAAAGVSTMTVSLALRRDPRIKRETRDRVLAVAAKLGYRPNPLVSALMTGLRGWHPRGHRAHILAYVESFPRDAAPQQAASLQRFRAGAITCAAAHGYKLQVFQMGETGLSEARLEAVLTARGIRGVVFAPFPTVGTMLQQSWQNHALAAVGFSLARPPLHRAVNHHLHSFQLTLDRLLTMGYKRIGFATSRHEDSRVERNWTASALLTQLERAAADLAFPILVEAKIESRLLHTWVRKQCVEVVVSTEDGVRRMLAGVDVNVGFVHLHLTSSAAGCTGIDQNNEQVGAAAVELVVGQLHANSYGFPANPKTVLLEGSWIAGTTARGPCVLGRERTPR